MGSVNKVIIVGPSDLVAMYESGLSTTQIASQTGLNQSRVRKELVQAGVKFRTKSESLRIREGLGQHAIGRRREITPEWRSNMSKARLAWGEANAKGYSLKAAGYIEFTRGEHKGRAEHVIIMEQRLGRRLHGDECVHHIDRNRANNSADNLALVTRAGHTRLHRFEDALEGKKRNRTNGRFS